MSKLSLSALLATILPGIAMARSFAISPDAGVAVAETPVAVTPAAANDTTFPRDVRYRFNKDDAGFQRPPVELKVPVPSLAGIIAILQAGMTADKNTDEGKKAVKAMDYMIELCGDAIIKEIRGYISDTPAANQDNIPWDKYTFFAIANMPAGIRGASGIAKELWDKFAKDYVAVMVSNNVSAENAAARVSVFVQKFRPLTGNPERKNIITNLMATLAVYVDKTTNSEEFSPILEFLNKKADELKSEDSVVTSTALGFA